MAVSIDNFSAWVTIDGASCPTYSLRYWVEGKEATCWIPSQDGKKFSVNWSNTYRDRPIYARLYIDGVSCSIHFMLDMWEHPEDASCIGISYATTSDYTRRDFEFSKIVVTDDEAYLHTVEDPPAFGIIRLELWEADIASIRRAPFQHTYGSQVLESQVIHEMSKKAGSHHVRFGNEYIVSQPLVNIVAGTPTGTAALATFVFKYRPAPMLMAIGIIPRPVAASSGALQSGSRANVNARQKNPNAQSKAFVKTEAMDMEIINVDVDVDERIHDLEAQLATLRARKEMGLNGKASAPAPCPGPADEDDETQWRVDPRTGRVLQVYDFTNL
ncbi:hypothetical protein C8F01DRAFT_1098424 [Mycena amicta]|nr:hypothetical protein C8F01DRAFT_1098424 [Mycena amicta]